jgi:hypothetical protein
LSSTKQIFGWREGKGAIASRLIWRPSIAWSLAIATAIVAALAYVPAGVPFIYFQF